MNQNWKKIIGFAAAIFMLSCKNGEPKCAFGKPTPIFNGQMPTVVQHTFESMPNNGSHEAVAFRDRTFLTITQSGCDHLEQEFMLVSKGNFEKFDDTAWKNLAIQHFDRLSKTVSSFSQWRDVITTAFDDLKLGQSVEIQQNTYLKIDKIKKQNMAALVVKIEQR